MKKKSSAKKTNKIQFVVVSEPIEKRKTKSSKISKTKMPVPPLKKSETEDKDTTKNDVVMDEPSVTSLLIESESVESSSEGAPASLPSVSNIEEIRESSEHSSLGSSLTSSSISIELEDEPPIADMSKDEFVESLDTFYNRWMNRMQSQGKVIDQFRLAIQLFESMADTDNEGNLLKGYAKTVDKLSSYMLYLVNNVNMFEDEDEKLEYRRKIDQMIRVAYQYHQAFQILNKNNSILLGHEATEEEEENKGQFTLTPSIMEYLTPENLKPKYNDKQKLQVRLLKQLTLRGYRKYGEFCYEQIYSKDKEPTHAWKQACKLEDFINDQCNRYENPENWDVLTKTSRTGLQDMLDKLITLNDPEFPTLCIARSY